jgi:hypothetical protein
MMLWFVVGNVAAAPLTLYHVNPKHEGPLPIDMDTADVYGDMFFDLRSKVLPIECANSTSSHGWRGDCANGEVVDNDLVISKISMTVKKYGEYSRCNICLKNGYDRMSGLPCTPGQYICTCGSYHQPRDCTNDTAVGVMNITSAFGRFKNYVCTWDRWITAPWTCWSWPIVAKTGGMWYSTTRAGWCGAPGADPATCTWSATVEKVVNKSCSDDKVYAAVEEYDARKGGPGCFRACPDRRWHPFRARNTSDTCWIYCYYQTLLGASALLPSGGEISGMPLAQLREAFEQPFLPEAQGGCPDVKPAEAEMEKQAARRTHGLGAAWDERGRIADGMFRDVDAAAAEMAKQRRVESTPTLGAIA